MIDITREVCLGFLAANDFERTYCTGQLSVLRGLMSEF
jgi:hypothetical protein